MNHLKMYIAVLDEVPDQMVPVLVAHATLGAHLYFTSLEIWNNTYSDWLNESFRKVVLKVNRKEFEHIKKLDLVHLTHENSVLGAEKSCAVIYPREDNLRVLAFAKMWTPSSNIESSMLRSKFKSLEKEISDYSWQDNPRQGMY